MSAHVHSAAQARWPDLALLALAPLAACASGPATPSGADGRPPTPTSGRTVPGPTGALFVDDGGAGGADAGGASPVVFLHSLAGNASQWSAQLAHLRAGGRAVALDLRGHGDSDPPEDDVYSIRGYVEDVAAATERLGLDCFVLIGHSMGAAVAASYAATHPSRVGGLVLVDGAFARQEPTPEERAWLRGLEGDRYRELIEGHWRTILEGSRPAVRDGVLADLRATPRETVATSFRELADHDPIPTIRRYTGPSMLVLSDIGDNAMAAHHHVEGLPHEFIRSTGHWLQMDRPDRFNELLDAFLAHADIGCGR